MIGSPNEYEEILMRSTILGVLAAAILTPALVSQQAPPAPAPTMRPATLRVAAVQMRSRRDMDANVRHTIDLLRRCAADRVQVAVFPECSVSGYYQDLIPQLSSGQLDAAERQIAQACRELGITAIVGMPYRAGGKLYNSAIVIDGEGKVRERYHKIQLAEPWPDPGDHLSVFHLAGAPCSIIICHDERYPELVRLPVLAGARVIFYLSHESGIKQETKVAPYRAQIQARAVENSVFIVHANAPANADASGSHGQSRLIAPDGNLIQEASVFGEDIVSATLDLTKASADNARRSMTRGPLTDWWREGVRQVKRID
jgi:predicted amidohydrolase